MDLAGRPVSLWKALLSVPDHRRSEWKRYPLASLLLIAIAALLAGRHDQLGIIRWGRRLSRDTLTAIGIGRARIPAPSVWCELFQDLDIVALEQALGAWVRGGSAPGHVAIDGKRLRGSATAHSPGTHLLAAFSAGLQGVIGQLRVSPEANEITAALELLKTLPLQGVTVTGGAIFDDLGGGSATRGKATSSVRRSRVGAGDASLRGTGRCDPCRLARRVRGPPSSTTCTSCIMIMHKDD
jgi:hypothetical protein